jgi:hypothetical protein
LRGINGADRRHGISYHYLACILQDGVAHDFFASFLRNKLENIHDADCQELLIDSGGRSPGLNRNLSIKPGKDGG